MKILIIGGVAGGATTAARLRRVDENCQIIMFERGAYISYANCGLPYYIGDVINERSKLFVQTPASFGKRFNIDVRTNSEVIAIDKVNKRVDVKEIETGRIYKESYDKMVLSPGAEPVRPSIAGIENERIFTLRNVYDTDKIKTFINTNNPKSAVVVGAGFIGLEMAENLHNLGLSVSIVEMQNQVMPPIDYSMASIVHYHLKTKNVGLFLTDGVKAFDENDKITIYLQSGRTIETDMVILSIGVKADSRLAKETGLEIGITGGIKVNEYLQTSDISIYAVGDAIEFINPITYKPAISYLAGPAIRQARICADNIAFGNKIKYKGSIQTAIAKVFDLTVATTGASAKTLQKEGISFMESITHSASHAGYYPNSIPMTIKIVFDKKIGKLHGSQIVGIDGVDKRIDLIASIIKSNGSIYDLIEIEHAYAPPYSSAKDPVNIAGYVAENILARLMAPIQWHEIKDLDISKAQLVDVRTKIEHELGSIPNSINIPVNELRSNLDKLPKDKKIVIYCAVGFRGNIASRILLQYGFTDVVNLSGGYKTYELAVMEQNNNQLGENDDAMREDSINQRIMKTKETIKIDACGLQCPGPILQLKQTMDNVESGFVEISSTDQGFFRDVKSWCNITGNILHSLENKNGVITAVIKKSNTARIEPKEKQGKTFIVFSDDLDKALACFVLANGAIATGKKVTMFFTFWGLNIIKKHDKPKVSKDIFGKFFGYMLPSSSTSLKLSKLNMFGMGRIMMRYIMRNKNIESLETLIKQAQSSGVEFIACQMSMDVMGVKAEELMDGVIIGGVATYMEKAEQSNLNLFI